MGRLPLRLAWKPFTRRYTQAVLGTLTCAMAGDRINKAYMLTSVGYNALLDTLVPTGILLTPHATHVVESLVAMATESVTMEERLECTMYGLALRITVQYLRTPKEK